MAKLDGKHIGVLATNGFEDSEFSSPVEAVRQAGGAVTVLSPGGEKIEGKNGSTSEADASTENSRDAEIGRASCRERV